MANQKQRRRREKEKRHGIEIVEIDEEGNERVVERSELRPAAPPARVKGGKPAAGGKQTASRRGVPQPASWKRAGRRAAIFGPLFFAFILLTNRKGNVAGQVITALILIALFVPMSYYMDRFAYRMYQKRLGNEGARRGRR